MDHIAICKYIIYLYVLKQILVPNNYIHKKLKLCFKREKLYIDTQGILQTLFKLTLISKRLPALICRKIESEDLKSDSLIETIT